MALFASLSRKVARVGRDSWCNSGLLLLLLLLGRHGKDIYWLLLLAGSCIAFLTAVIVTLVVTCVVALS